MFPFRFSFALGAAMTNEERLNNSRDGSTSFFRLMKFRAVCNADSNSLAGLIFLGEQFFYAAFKVFSCVHSSENSFFIDEPHRWNGPDVVLDGILGTPSFAVEVLRPWNFELS